MNSPQAESNVEGYQERIHAMRSYFFTGVTRDLRWRERQLQGIERFCVEEESALLDALAKDLGKPRLESLMTEIGFCQAEANHLRKSLPKWMNKRRVRTNVAAQPGTSWQQAEPLGVVLIISPWNYPLQLALGPLIGAFAAGNLAVLKPSEFAPNTSALLEHSLPKYLDSDALWVVTGDVEVATPLLACRFDHIFYTGGPQVGKIVMRAAAEHLTPVTLELGGKSPAIVSSATDIEMAAKRIAWGKFQNAGQTCVAPDYVLCAEPVFDRFISAIKHYIREFYGSDPQKSESYGRIVNQRHFERVRTYLSDGDIIVGGEFDADSNYLEPTVLLNANDDAPVMQEEIFGPILPVRKVKDVPSACDFIRAREKPLALYLFGSSSEEEYVLENTSSGGVLLGHTLLHLAVADLPFGGVGQSGFGAYHGRASFDCFSHLKSVMKRPKFELPLQYPPYTDDKEKWIRRLLG